MAIKNRKKQEKSSAADADQKVRELEENWKRALADYRNLEKRIESQQQAFVRLANAALIDKLLSILDDLERAASHLKDDGLNLVIGKLNGVLDSEGVKAIKSEGEAFNPETMDCTEMVNGPKNAVTETVLKGYSLNDLVIRPAKVKVANGQAIRS